MRVSVAVATLCLFDVTDLQEAETKHDSDRDPESMRANWAVSRAYQNPDGSMISSQATVPPPLTFPSTLSLQAGSVVTSLQWTQRVIEQRTTRTMIMKTEFSFSPDLTAVFLFRGPQKDYSGRKTLLTGS